MKPSPKAITSAKITSVERTYEGRSGVVRFRKACENDMPHIIHRAKEWRLDDEVLDSTQVLVVEDAQEQIIGFGRIKPYPSCYELGTVGVDPKWRSRGLGKKIVARLI